MNTTSLRRFLALGAIAGLTLAATAGSAGAGAGAAAPLTIVKVVDGTAPAGTTFSVSVECEGRESEIEAADTTVVEFDATGQPTTPDTIFFDGPADCTVTETVNGGATSTTYSCVGAVPIDDIEDDSDAGAFQEIPVEPVCESAGPQAAPISVNIISPSQSATVTVVNTFPAGPQAAPLVVAQPAFTG